MSSINSFKRLPVNLPDRCLNTILRVTDERSQEVHDIGTNDGLLWACSSEVMKNSLSDVWLVEKTDDGKCLITLTTNYSLVEHVCSHPKESQRPEYRPPSPPVELTDAFRESRYLDLPSEYYGDKCVQKFRDKIRAADCNAVEWLNASLEPGCEHFFIEAAQYFLADIPRHFTAAKIAVIGPDLLSELLRFTRAVRGVDTRALMQLLLAWVQIQAQLSGQSAAQLLRCPIPNDGAEAKASFGDSLLAQFPFEAVPNQGIIQEAVFNAIAGVLRFEEQRELSAYLRAPSSERVSISLWGRPSVSRIEGLSIGQITPVGYVRIEPGEFMMGSPAGPDGEPGRLNDEIQHRVRITEPYLLKEKPVTQAEWQALMHNNPSYFTTDVGDDLAANRPVDQVSWFDAVTYCNALSLSEGIEPYYRLINAQGVPGTPGYTVERVEIDATSTGYRLPSEAEWEYAARAGSAGATYAAGNQTRNDLAWWSGNSGDRTHAVGQKAANAWGLFDMLGNVYQWCGDWYAAYVVNAVAIENPHGPDTGRYRVCRGGCYYSDERDVRAARRSNYGPSMRYGNFGIRPVRSVLLTH